MAMRNSPVRAVGEDILERNPHPPTDTHDPLVLRARHLRRDQEVDAAGCPAHGH